MALITRTTRRGLVVRLAVAVGLLLGAGLHVAPSSAAPVLTTMTWFDEPPQFAGRDGGALAIHSDEAHASVAVYGSDTELHMAGHLVPPGKPSKFQYIRMYVPAHRVIARGRYVVGPEMTLVLDNGTTCRARSGEVVIHELVTVRGVVFSAAVSIRASWTGAPSWSLCTGDDVFAEVRWRSAVPVAAPEHAGTSDLGRIASGGTSQPQTWVVANDGTTALQLGALSIGGRHRSDVTVVADDCTGTKLAPGTACSVGYRVSPGATGERRALLKLADDSRRGGRAHLVLSHGT